jgi:hypothetical protein
MKYRDRPTVQFRLITMPAHTEHPGSGPPLAPAIAFVLVLGLAAALYLVAAVAHPPAGIPAAAAGRGAMLMYYGGDLIELLLVLCAQWYRASRPLQAAWPG